MRLVAGFPPWRPGFGPRYGHVGFVVGKVEMGQFFLKYVGFPLIILILLTAPNTRIIDAIFSLLTESLNNKRKKTIHVLLFVK
jgi:hypothetical protein